MPATTRAITDDDLMRLPKDGRKYEVVDGELPIGDHAEEHDGDGQDRRHDRTSDEGL